MKNPTIAFLFTTRIDVPSNLREYYISEDLTRRGYKVLWFYTSNSNYSFKKDFLTKKVASRNGHRTTIGKYFFHPAYLVWIYLRFRVNIAWISGWSERKYKYLLWYMFLLRMLGIKVVYDPIDPILEYAIATHKRLKYKKMKTIISRAIYRLASLVVAVNEHQKEMLALSGVANNKIFVGIYGTNVSFFNNRKKQGLTAVQKLDLKDRFVLGWIGYMTLFKGLEEILVPLIMHLYKELPGVHFLIAGDGDGELLDRFKLLQDSGSYPLTLLGRVRYEELYDITSMMNIYIVPTKTNGQFSQSVLPIKILDAIACGVPVVTTRTPLLEQVKKEYDSISLVDFSYQSYKEEIIKICCCYNEYRLKAIHAKEHIGKYDNRQIAIAICDCLEKNVIGRNR